MNLNNIFFNPYRLEKSDSLTERERSSVIQSVEEDRRLWLQACIVRIMKREKQATFAELIPPIQKEAGGGFQESSLLCTRRNLIMIALT